MANAATPGSVDEYIAAQPAEAARALEELRSLVHATVPGVTERISYGMPTFDVNGKYLVYFGGWKKHIGLYPISANLVEALEKELEPYLSGKGSAQFPLARPMPVDLIRRIIEFRQREVTAA